MRKQTAQADIQAHVNGALRFIASPGEASFLMRSRFHAFEGGVDASRHLRIGLNIGETAWYCRRSGAANVDTSWRRNGITVNLPNDEGYGRSTAVTMIGIAVDLDSCLFDDVRPVSADALSPLASQVIMDSVAAHQIRHLFACAELHGCSSAFFSEQLGFLLRRLVGGCTTYPQTGVARLDERRLKAVCDLIEENLGNDLTVREMALSVQMDPTNFAKAFRSATGQAPFSYLTSRRMNAAKNMLTTGQSVTAIALSLNYSNPSKFAAAFKRCTGKSPTEWVGRCCSRLSAKDNSALIVPG